MLTLNRLPHPEPRTIRQRLDAAGCWLNYERRNWLAIVGVAAIMGAWWANGHTTQNSVQAIADKQGQTAHALIVTQHKLKALEAPQTLPSTPTPPKD